MPLYDGNRQVHLHGKIGKYRDNIVHVQKPAGPEQKRGFYWLAAGQTMSIKP